jgi:predicted Zn-dependent peptidase
MVGIKRILSFAVVVAVAWSTQAEAGYKRVNKDNPKDGANVHIYALDNGLTVYLSENHEKPEFYAEIVVRAGYKHDPAETTGLAHYLEHLLFKGTQKVGTADWAKEKVHIDRIEMLYEKRFRETDPAKRDSIYALINKESQLAAQYAIPGEVDRLYQSMGSTYINAHTWFEETVYKVGLPSNRLEQWAMIETERFQKPVYRLFQPELEVVYEEKNRAMDDKERKINELVDRELFKVHPYGQQTGLGTVEHLKNPSLRNIHNFFSKYYVPGNMAVIIAGDIEVENAIQVIDRHFSAWEKKKVPSSGSWKEPKLKGVDRVETTHEGEEKVIVAFRTVHNRHKDAPALSIADELLDNSRAGLMNQLEQRQEVREAGAHRLLMNDHGAEQFEGIPKKGQTLEEVERLLLAQVETLKKGDFDETLIQAIVNNYKKGEKRGQESNNARVAAMRKSYASFKDWDDSVEELDELSKVTKQDVMRVAKKYFGENYVVGYRRDAPHEVPKIEKPQIDPVDIDATRMSAFAEQVSAVEVAALTPDYVEPSDYTVVEYAPGAKLYYSQNPLNDLFILRIGVELGFNQDNRIQFAQKLLDLSGTGSSSNEELKTEWFKLATDFSFSTGSNSSAFSISGLDENLRESLDLMLRVINEPIASKETLDEMVKIVLADRDDSKKDPRAIRGALAIYNRNGKQSRYLRMLPSGALAQFTVEELHGLAKSLLGYEQTITYVGSLPVEEVVAQLKAKYPIKGKLRKTPPYLSLKVEAPESTVLRMFHKEMAQAQVYVEFGGIDYDEAVTPEAQVFSEYFSGGMSGLLFQEIREARALAYSVYAGYSFGDRIGDQNLNWGGMGTQADKAGEAIEAYLGLFDEMPVEESRFETAKEALINNYRTGKTSFREVLGAVRGWQHLGLEPDPRKARYEAVQKATLETLTSFHANHIKGRPRLISVVGDTSKIDMDRLGKVAKPEMMSLGDILAY